MTDITNLGKRKDAFEELEEDEGSRQGFCHIRIQQRTGRKTITTVQGVGTEYDLKKIVKYLKKSTEVAHLLVYGSGQLTWEWHVGLRSYLHPLLIACIYKLLDLTPLHSNHLAVFHAPRIFSALLFSISDLYFLKLCHKLCPSKTQALFAFLNYLTLWFPYYCAPRTLANSLETALTVIALNWYPFTRSSSYISIYIVLGLLTIVLRPTAALLWLVFGLAHFFSSQEKFDLILRTVLPSAVFVLGLTTLVDFYFYGRLTVPLWNFLQFNVLAGGSAMFGVHPWYWYFTEGLPAVLTIQLLPIAYGLSKGLRLLPHLPAIASGIFILFHLFLPHKEHRFLLPILPLLCLYSGTFYTRMTRPKKIFFCLTVLVNALVALFTARFHQVGPYALMDSVIRRTQEHHLQNVGLMSLMPCYSLPGHTYAHSTIQDIVQLQCQPQLEMNISIPSRSGRSAGFLDSDEFFSNPQGWIAKNAHFLDAFNFVVLYEKLWVELGANIPNFSLCDRLFHSHFLTSSREDHYALVLCHN